MIKEIQNFLTETESQWYIDWYKRNQNLRFNLSNEYVQNYEGIEVNKMDENFPLFKKISPDIVNFVRIQKTDTNIKPLPNPHRHQTPYNFIIFLNEGFDGGNLVFERGEVFKPKTGTMILFGDEPHYPTPVTKGERWVIACFLNSWIDTQKVMI